MKKIYGAFYEVNIEKRLNFKDIFAINLDLTKCTKGDFKVDYSDDVEKQGIFISGTCESNNSPDIIITETLEVYSISLVQLKPKAEGLLHITLILPKKKFNYLSSSGDTMEFNVIGGEFSYINLSNNKGNINVNVKTKRACLFSKYYPIKATLEVTDKTLCQVGSRMGNVNLKLLNAGKVNIKPDHRNTPNFASSLLQNAKGYEVNLFVIGNFEGNYTITQA